MFNDLTKICIPLGLGTDPEPERKHPRRSCLVSGIIEVKSSNYSTTSLSIDVTHASSNYLCKTGKNRQVYISKG